MENYFSTILLVLLNRIAGAGCPTEIDIINKIKNTNR